MPSDTAFSYKQRLWIISAIFFLPVILIYTLSGAPTYTLLQVDPQLPVITEVYVQRNGEEQEHKIALPFNVDANDNELFNFRVSLDYAHGQSGIFWFKGDDCVRQIIVGDTKVELSEDTKNHLCDWEDGFRLDLSGYLQPGKNDILIEVMNNSGKSSLFFKPIPQ
jgi:hypothetical protein